MIAVVTGASSGIGSAIAQELAAPDVVLCVIGRNRARLEGVAGKIEGKTSKVVCLSADFRKDEDLRRLINEIHREIDSLDLLIHSAGTSTLGPIESAPVEALDEQYAVNIRAPVILTQSLLPMLQSSKGQIVFINSSAGLTARANVGQYAATKHALKAIADSLREEVNTDGVRVISVYPGRTASAMQAAIFETEGRPYQPERLMQPGDVAKAVINALKLPRTAEVTDLMMRPMIDGSSR